MVLLEEVFSPRKIQSFVDVVMNLHTYSLNNSLPDDLKVFLESDNIKDFLEIHSHVKNRASTDPQTFASLVSHALISTAINGIKVGHPYHEYIKKSVAHRYQRAFLANVQRTIKKAFKRVIEDEFITDNGGMTNDDTTSSTRDTTPNSSNHVNNASTDCNLFHNNTTNTINVDKTDLKESTNENVDENFGKNVGEKRTSIVAIKYDKSDNDGTTNENTISSVNDTTPNSSNHMNNASLDCNLFHNNTTNTINVDKTDLKKDTNENSDVNFKKNIVRKRRPVVVIEYDKFISCDNLNEAHNHEYFTTGCLSDNTTTLDCKKYEYVQSLAQIHPPELFQNSHINYPLMEKYLVEDLKTSKSFMQNLHSIRKNIKNPKIAALFKSKERLNSKKQSKVEPIVKIDDHIIINDVIQKLRENFGDKYDTTNMTLFQAKGFLKNLYGIVLDRYNRATRIENNSRLYSNAKKGKQNHDDDEKIKQNQSDAWSIDNQSQAEHNQNDDLRPHIFENAVHILQSEITNYPKSGFSIENQFGRRFLSELKSGEMVGLMIDVANESCKEHLNVLKRENEMEMTTTLKKMKVKEKIAKVVTKEGGMEIKTTLDNMKMKKRIVKVVAKDGKSVRFGVNGGVKIERYVVRKVVDGGDRGGFGELSIDTESSSHITKSSTNEKLRALRDVIMINEITFGKEIISGARF